MTGEEAHGAIFVTSGSFTPDAIDFARGKPIKLVDGRELVETLRGVQPKRRTSPSPGHTQTVKPPPVTRAEGAITCPRCRSAMVKRVPKQGVERGNVFWGCSRFRNGRNERLT